jgi:hypothetical protein
MKKSCLLSLFGILPVLALSGCQPQNAGPGGPGTAVINSNSLITGEIKAVRQQSSGFPWEIDVLVLTSSDVGDLPNPVKDKVGQVVTARTDEDAGSLKPGQKITANLKYVGDVPRPGITLYIFNIKVIQ